MGVPLVVALLLSSCSMPPSEEEPQGWRPASASGADASVPTLVAGDTEFQPLVSSWDGTGRPTSEPSEIRWEELPEFTIRNSSIELSVESRNPPERVVLQVFDSVDSNGIPRGDGEEIVCGYDDGADDCVIEAESDGELTRLKIYSNRLATGFGTIQMTWLRLAGEDVQEVWSSWGTRVGGDG